MVRGQVTRSGTTVTKEIQASFFDHEINYVLSLQKAGQSVQPNLSLYTVADVIQTVKNFYPLYGCTVFHKMEILDPKHSHSVFADLEDDPTLEKEITFWHQHIINTITVNNSNNCNITSLFSFSDVQEHKHGFLLK